VLPSKEQNKKMIPDIFQQQPVLENERVLLRALRESDFKHLLPFSLQEPEIWQFGYVTAAGADNLEKYIAAAVSNLHQKKEYPFVVFDKKTNVYAGSTRFYDIQQTYLTTQLGFTWYGKNFQRSGLNRHCKWLLLQYAFEQWGLERVEFRSDLNNKKSIAAMKAIGCVEEGILRSQMPKITGGRRDTIVLSIIKDDWLSHVKERFQELVY
jgi:RimJ/RimL family protein N-acetyltransferase